MPPAAVIRSLLVFDDKHPLYPSYRVAKRIAISVVGGTMIVIGIVLVIMPVVPGFPAILVGLGILALEFAWARIWLKKAKQKAGDVARSFHNRNGQLKQGSDRNPPPPGED